MRKYCYINDEKHAHLYYSNSAIAYLASAPNFHLFNPFASLSEGFRALFTLFFFLSSPPRTLLPLPLNKPYYSHPFASCLHVRESNLFTKVMGNSHGSRLRKKPHVAGPAAITEPILVEPQTTVIGSFPSTDCQSWDPGSEEAPKKPGRPNSLEILVKQALENYIAEDDIDPKFGVQRQCWQDEASFEFSELPVEHEEDLFK